MYTDINFPTKKALRQAVENGDEVTVYQPGPYGPEVKDGPGCVEGPHERHKWYAEVQIQDGVIVGKVK